MTPSHSPTGTSLLKLFGIPERLISLVDYDFALQRLLAIVFHKKVRFLLFHYTSALGMVSAEVFNMRRLPLTGKRRLPFKDGVNNFRHLFGPDYSF